MGKKEDDKILAILGELDDKYADITENSNVSVSSASEEQEMNSLYNESIPISEDDFIQRSASRKTKKENQKLLKQYLVNHGTWGGKASTIESISFGNSWNGPVAYVRVRGALKTIKNKMKQLNKKKGAVLSIYERRQYHSGASEENNVLFVNNFAITDKTVHRRFTNLFLQFGQLVKDIKMGIDKHADPYAIVHFAHLDAARECFNTTVDSADGIRFGGRKLSVKYSTM